MKKVLNCFILLFITISCSNNEVSGSSGEVVSEACQIVLNAVEEARLKYTTTTQAESEQNCENYKKALESQILVCGDKDGSIQNTIDSLKDCSLVD